MNVDVKPDLYRWACDRAGKSHDDLAERFPKLHEWISGASQPTFKQLEKFAKATHTPLGYFFLTVPPVEVVPIPDCRTIRSVAVGRPSADMLDTIYACQARQAWYREHLQADGEKPLQFVGSATTGSDITATAAAIRRVLGIDLEERKTFRSKSDTLRNFIDAVERAGILVQVNGVVGSNNTRKLDPQEFRGFALVDDLAPLIFINGSDSKAAQIFTLAHEIAHVWLGESALTDASPATTHVGSIEQWCNLVAAETLVPAASLRQEFRNGADIQAEISRLAALYKVSNLVMIRRACDIGAINRDLMKEFYAQEVQRLRDVPKAEGSGGDFYATTSVRVGKRFARALISSTLAGGTLYRDALKMLGVSKVETLTKLGRELGVG